MKKLLTALCIFLCIGLTTNAQMGANRNITAGKQARIERRLHRMELRRICRMERRRQFRRRMVFQSNPGDKHGFTFV